ncbi:MAG: PKD domain-containing protein [Anaerolineae bacterium]|jgi:PKD repeat protein|nr:PKD domain-containing protein [Anaerolineae bacterium]
MRIRPFLFGMMVLALTFVLAACNLTSEPEQPIELTALPTITTTPQQQATLSGVPTGVSVTALPFFTQVAPPTSIGFVPPQPVVIPATATPSTISIVILSPIYGNVIAQNVQILGAATHPNFLQYVVEYGPDPNPNNLWYPIGGARQTPVLNGVLGIWTTTNIPDGQYQLRLRVYLRDGSTPQTVVNNLRVQNSAPTVAPTSTSTTPRPIAAFTADRTSGEAPLVVRFNNQSSGQINSYNWNFGDGSSSAERNPTHVFRTPGEYEVRLTVVGPGGRSNVSQVIDVFVDPPTASFEIAPGTNGTAPFTVQFTDRSSGQINDYLWDFGDGTRSNERNPSHTYTAQGNYNVFLRVRGPGGANRAYALIAVVNPQIPPPVANFSPDNTGGDAPLTLQFTDLSTGQVTAYRWEFGDGVTSSDANPIHRYEQPGDYTVRLTVSGPGGSSTKQGVVNVTRAPQAPEAAFVPNVTSGNAPLTVTFDNQTTGDVTGYLWEFADGTTSTDAEPTHTFTEPGTYIVRLTARGQNNLSDFTEVEISAIRPQTPPSAVFSVNPTAGSAPLTVQITNQSAGDDVTYSWDLGDGTTTQTTEPVFSHTYAINGSFTIRLTVSGPGGSDSTATQTVSVSDTLAANFNVQPLNQPEGLSFQFNDASSGQITGWAWDFGDGTNSVEQNPVKVYNANGAYSVTLTVTDTFGGSASFSQNVNATQPPTQTPEPSATLTATLEPTQTFTATLEATATATEAASATLEPSATVEPSATATAEPSATAIPEPTATDTTPAPTAGFTFTASELAVAFQDLSVGATEWVWDFGDGNGSTEQNPRHAYGAAGDYNVTLTVRNAGGENTANQNVSVREALPPAPTAGFTFTVTDLSVAFQDLSTGATEWLWDFGDGNTSADQNPTHVYAAANEYNVTLTVRNAGGENTTNQTVSVREALPPAPTAGFTFTVTDLSVAFQDLSTGATEWAWDFGDGSTSADQNPTHVYAAANNYNVTLTVRNAGGESTTNQTVSVSEAAVAPTADFTFEATELSVAFTDTSSEGIESWAWDFGDGNTSADQNPTHVYAEANTYRVTLTVTQGGLTGSVTYDVTVEATPEEPSEADEAPVLPDLGALRGNLNAIVVNSDGSLKPDVFAVVGDRTAQAPNFLRAFADSYELGEVATDLEATIQAYLAGDAGGSNSFARAGSAVQNSFNADTILNGDGGCGSSPLVCELDATAASVVIISLGYRDAVEGTDMAQFEERLRAIVDTTTARGVIPVLLTPFPRPELGNTVRDYADAIVRIADEKQVPLVNVWGLFATLPDGGMAGDDPTVAGAGAARLNNNTVSNFGENARNFNVLSLLRDIRAGIFGQ